MRILVAHNSTYYPSHGGGDKSNRLLMEALAERGHQIRVIARVEKFGAAHHEKLLAQLHARGLNGVVDSDGAVQLTLHGVDVRTLSLRPHLRAYFAQQIQEFDPDIIITSTDDPGQLLFDVALGAPRARVVYLVRATIAVPFGPDSSMPSEQKTDMLRRADKVVGVSQYVANYVQQWGGIPAAHVPISLLEPGEYPNLGSFTNPFVAMVNPCLVKGITIFVELADRMPELSFAAVPTWGTTAGDMAELRKRPNITLLDPVDNIDDLLRQTKVMLVPSLWAEARSRIVVEAMARAIPVISSDLGGLPEAHMGVPYLLPATPIKHYKPALDGNMVPVAEVPPQDIGPWQKALARLVRDPAHYDEIAAASRQAALQYAEKLSVQPFETVLHEILQQPKTGVSAVHARRPDARISEEKQKLLALRLRQRGVAAKPATHPWFAGLEDVRPGRRTLYCFPYAGGGTRLYRSWQESLPEATVVAVRLPGRETRIAEKPFESMESLVDAIGAEFVKVARQPFSFFGHSMGAGIAFELTRWLRRNGATNAEALCVSSARAPQLRTEAPGSPEPDDTTFLEEIRRLEGVPQDVLQSPELLRLALPALRSDARLYRQYVYRPEPPLDIPLAVYGGATDPSLQPEHLDAWREQTTARFLRREFKGGHFFIQTATEDLTGAIRADAIA